MIATVSYASKLGTYWRRDDRDAAIICSVIFKRTDARERYETQPLFPDEEAALRLAKAVDVELGP